MKVCLVVIDGWGSSKETKGNAIYNGNTPVMDSLTSTYPSLTIDAHGLSVGLPEGQMGNSEVGHLNIGAGSIVYQDIVRINKSIEEDAFDKNEVLQEILSGCQGRLHLIGIVSDGGVHGHISHLKKLILSAKKTNKLETYVHCITDGRDTQPTVADKHIEDLLNFMKENSYGSISTLIGRYYAMDRDNRWERIKKTIDCFVSGVGEETSDIPNTIRRLYSESTTDEFLPPIVANKKGLIEEGDSIIFFNYRADRMRQICTSFVKRLDENIPKNLSIASMTRYEKDLPCSVMFDSLKVKNGLSEWVSKMGLKQCHIAETEKYAHVTFFFNGRIEKPFKEEKRILIQSPKVATYDLKPEMCSWDVSEAVNQEMKEGEASFIMCNFAPPDMVGHTGVYQAAVKAVEATDMAIGEIYKTAIKEGYILVITSDHGNAETMTSSSGGAHKAHTTSQVPFIICASTVQITKPENRNPALCDVAPTILSLLDLDQPEEMEGVSLIIK
eukprot:GHVP01059367.1.p1 GENE.GHVP01059367.1~~GHVP01059367.1.p1  ORF type:complete len:499 (+),score=92.95 GHVP01059367.1:432-1928(+)